jgi:membrane protein
MLVFFLLYYLLPNTRVQARAAIWGAAVAALVWMLGKNLFGYYITEYKPYSTMYGVLALIPITVLWIYITWLIVLFGLQLTFTTQHLRSIDAAEISAARRTEQYFMADEITVIEIMREVARRFQASTAPVSAGAICSKLNLPAEFGGRILDFLVAHGQLAKTSEPKIGFVPAKEPADIRLSDISSAVASADFGGGGREQSESLRQIAALKQELFERYSLQHLMDDG